MKKSPTNKNSTIDDSRIDNSTIDNSTVNTWGSSTAMKTNAQGTPSTSVSFADVVSQILSFDRAIPSQALVLELIDTRWVQRLRDLSQTANTRLVYMFSEHSRFGHSLGVAGLAEQVMTILSAAYPAQVEPYRKAVASAALLHDIGHIAPGCHTAYKTWFPHGPDRHEEVGARIITQNTDVNAVLAREGDNLVAQVASILGEDSKMPPWTWQLISGGGWNGDRGNWCIVDSLMAGVSYGQYNIPALIESLVLTDDGHLALRENRLDAMMHFAVSRHALYRQLYQHRVLLAADTLNRAIAQRARDVGNELIFVDDTMNAVLSAKDVHELALDDIFAMTESWWRYHVSRWSSSSDSVMRDLCLRLLGRNLLKTVRVDNAPIGLEEARLVVEKAGFDPRYYLHEVSTFDTHTSDLEQSMPVLQDSGKLSSLIDADPLFRALLSETGSAPRKWFVMPSEAKRLLGRQR